MRRREEKTRREDAKRRREEKTQIRTVFLSSGFAAGIDAYRKQWVSMMETPEREKVLARHGGPT